MSRVFRVTYARTTYTELDIEAADAGAAERAAETLLRVDPARCVGGAPLGKPIFRIVEVADDEASAVAAPVWRRPELRVPDARETASA